MSAGVSDRWMEVRVTARKTGGRLKYVQHGIGRTLEEAVESARVPDNFEVLEAEPTRKNVDPTIFDIFHKLDMFEEARDEIYNRSVIDT